MERIKETVIKYFSICRFLLAKVKTIIIACNAASALYGRIPKTFDIPIIGVIEPGVKAAISLTRNNTIGVIGTEGTINSQSYQEK